MTTSSLSALAALGEFGLISRLTSGVSPHTGVVTGIGDDAAVTSLSAGMQLLTSTDMLLEEVHFRRAWHDPYRLGRKSLAASLSDIAAMGGVSRWALLSLAIPSDLPLEFLDEFMRGFLALASEHNVALIGGDTCSSRSGMTVSVTVMGEQYPDRIVRRSGALPDDDIWVTGTLGDAALALRLLEKGEAVSRELVSRLLDPIPRISAALALAEAGLATAMIDVSDGLLADFGHVAGQSAVGGCLQLDDIPLSPVFRKHSAQLPVIPYQMVLSGGEDYELCFTAHRSSREKIVDCMKKCGNTVTRIGIVTSFSGVTVVNRDGSTYSAQHDGFNHFT
jgi:thiamine-monophosphate kinase